MSETLEVRTSEEDDSSVISLIGRIDTNTAPQFEEAYQQLLDDGKTKIIVDMVDCVYISSAGLRVLISLHKKLMMGGTLIVRHANSDIRNVFTMTGFDNILKII